MTGVILAAAGFLTAVLWFDLMFDVQVWRHRRAPQVPDDVLDSISAYYRRVLTTASPMGRLVGLVMVVLLGTLVWQAVDGDAPGWVSIVSLPAALLGTGLALARVVRRALRLGAATDTRAAQSELARSIFRDHLVCLASMMTVLVVQLAGG